MTNKNSSNMTVMQMRTLKPEGQVPLKNATPQSLRKSNTEKRRRRQRYLKKEPKSRKRRMRTRKGPKGRTPPGPQHTFAGQEEEGYEELEHRTEPFKQQPVENTTKRTPIAANCLKKAVKRKPQAEERKTE